MMLLTRYLKGKKSRAKTNFTPQTIATLFQSTPMIGNRRIFSQIPSLRKWGLIWNPSRKISRHRGQGPLNRNQAKNRLKNRRYLTHIWRKSLRLMRHIWKRQKTLMRKRKRHLFCIILGVKEALAASQLDTILTEQSTASNLRAPRIEFWNQAFLVSTWAVSPLVEQVVLTEPPQGFLISLIAKIKILR